MDQTASAAALNVLAAAYTNSGTNINTCTSSGTTNSNNIINPTTFQSQIYNNMLLNNQAVAATTAFMPFAPYFLIAPLQQHMSAKGLNQPPTNLYCGSLASLEHYAGFPFWPSFIQQPPNDISTTTAAAAILNNNFMNLNQHMIQKQQALSQNINNNNNSNMNINSDYEMSRDGPPNSSKPDSVMMNHIPQYKINNFNDDSNNNNINNNSESFDDLLNRINNANPRYPKYTTISSSPASSTNTPITTFANLNDSSDQILPQLSPLNRTYAPTPLNQLSDQYGGQMGSSSGNKGQQQPPHHLSISSSPLSSDSHSNLATLAEVASRLTPETSPLLIKSPTGLQNFGNMHNNKPTSADDQHQKRSQKTPPIDFKHHKKRHNKTSVDENEVVKVKKRQDHVENEAYNEKTSHVTPLPAYVEPANGDNSMKNVVKLDSNLLNASAMAWATLTSQLLAAAEMQELLMSHSKSLNPASAQPQQQNAPPPQLQHHQAAQQQPYLKNQQNSNHVTQLSNHVASLSNHVTQLSGHVTQLSSQPSVIQKHSQNLAHQFSASLDQDGKNSDQSRPASMAPSLSASTPAPMLPSTSSGPMTSSATPVNKSRRPYKRRNGFSPANPADNTNGGGSSIFNSMAKNKEASIDDTIDSVIRLHSDVHCSVGNLLKAVPGRKSSTGQKSAPKINTNYSNPLIVPVASTSLDFHRGHQQNNNSNGTGHVTINSGHGTNNNGHVTLGANSNHHNSVPDNEILDLSIKKRKLDTSAAPLLECTKIIDCSPCQNSSKEPPPIIDDCFIKEIASSFNMNSANKNEPSQTTSTNHRRGRRPIEANQIRKPLSKGWRRETFVRSISSSGIRGDVIYYSPCGRRFSSIAEVARYLKNNSDNGLNVDHFTYSSKIIVGDFFYFTPEGTKSITEDDINAMVANIRQTNGNSKPMSKKFSLHKAIVSSIQPKDQKESGNKIHMDLDYIRQLEIEESVAYCIIDLVNYVSLACKN